MSAEHDHLSLCLARCGDQPPCRHGAAVGVHEDLLSNDAPFGTGPLNDPSASLLVELLLAATVLVPRHEDVTHRIFVNLIFVNVVEEGVKRLADKLAFEGS